MFTNGRADQTFAVIIIIIVTNGSVVLLMCTFHASSIKCVEQCCRQYVYQNGNISAELSKTMISSKLQNYTDSSVATVFPGRGWPKVGCCNSAVYINYDVLALQSCVVLRTPLQIVHIIYCRKILFTLHEIGEILFEFLIVR